MKLYNKIDSRIFLLWTCPRLNLEHEMNLFHLYFIYDALSVPGNTGLGDRMIKLVWGFPPTKRLHQCWRRMLKIKCAGDKFGISIATVTVMLVTSLWWWPIWDVSGRIIMLVPFRYVSDFSNVFNRSPTSETCPQHIWSPTCRMLHASPTSMQPSPC